MDYIKLFITFFKLLDIKTKNEICHCLYKKLKPLELQRLDKILMLQEFLLTDNFNIDKTKEIIDDYLKYAGWTIKFNLLKEAKEFLTKNKINVSTLLELSSGRGNDLKKWSEAKIENVIGLDIDPEQHKEAIKRYKYRHKSINVKVKYYLGSALDYNLVKSILKNSKVNLIANNFAMNYFFKDQETIDSFFRVVSDSLNTGGLFIGTATDGDAIDYLIKNRPNDLKNNLFSIEPINSNSYKFKLETPFFKDNENSHFITEYIINKNNLILNAKKFSLEPVSIIKDLDSVFNFTEFHDCPKNIYGIASLYFGFSFIKV